MLYKKYHRDYVRKFKKGNKIRFETSDKTYIDTVEIEPFIDRNLRKIRTFGKYRWALVSPAGKLFNNISIIEDVV